MRRTARPRACTLRAHIGNAGPWQSENQNGRFRPDGQSVRVFCPAEAGCCPHRECSALQALLKNRIPVVPVEKTRPLDKAQAGRQPVNALKFRSACR